MNLRTLGKTNYKISEIGFGAWAIGADWGDVSETDALAALRAAIEEGVNFIDTADVYGDGRSESLIAQIRKDYPSENLTIATKAGRRLDPHTTEGYNYDNLSAFIARSLKNLEVDALDLVQLHCPPTDVYRQNIAFDALDKLKQEGLVKHYGVSVETVEEAQLAMQHEGVASIQLIYNMFRLKPAMDLFKIAEQNNVGIIARVPLASGMLSGKMTKERSFAASDHRNYNREGAAFDIGETFSGVDFEKGLDAAEELKALVPEGASLAQLALKWILMSNAVSAAIPGAKNVQQAVSNAQASKLANLADSTMEKVQAVYDANIRADVHHRW